MTETPPQPGRECWRIERADQMSVIVDAEDYFRFARRAMVKAKSRIMLIGWDFDARIVLDHDVAPGDGPDTVGALLPWLCERNPDLEIYLLRWDMGAVKTLLRGTTLLAIWRWIAHPRIHTRLDAHHPTGASHHQKVVVIDDAIAFCGGIDMTSDRWDTREHRDDQPLRAHSFGRQYKPWHDAITALSGPAAAALGELFRERWHAAGGASVAPVADAAPCWPDGLRADFEAIDVAIARTLPEMPDQSPVYESEALFLKHIAEAKRHLYIESQYFASRRIGEAIARRLDEADGPEIVIVNPVTAQGWLEPLAMDTARARLMKALGRRDRHRRLRLYHPHTAGRQPIYVHAKILIADDRVLRLGSSNMNNRSLRLDSECDIAIDARGDTERACVTAIRDGLLAEHLGVTRDTIAATIAETGSLIDTIEQLRGRGRTLRPYAAPNLNAVERWLADNEVLDPEGPGEMFEALSKRGLFRNWRNRRG